MVLSTVTKTETSGVLSKKENYLNQMDKKELIKNNNSSTERLL